MSDKNQLSLLDQFALAALAGGLGQGEPRISGGYEHDAETIASRAYDIALAMRDANKLRAGAAGSDPTPSKKVDSPKPEREPASRFEPMQVGNAAMTIKEFCASNGGISKAFLYKLMKEGKGPRLMKVGRRVLITTESGAEWREKMQRAAA